MGFPRTAYGSNPNADVSPNDDHGWGGYQWPAGVPAELLGHARYRTRAGENIDVTVRAELVPLFELLYEITDRMGYAVHTHDPDGSGEFWGPWSYENRPIGDTNQASNHSRGKANDVNSPHNPQSRTFTSTWPPDVIAQWELCGFYWGGRYSGGVKFDPMHVEYAYSPADVRKHMARAETIVRRLRDAAALEPGHPNPEPTPAPGPAPEEDEEKMFTVLRDVETDYHYLSAPGEWLTLGPGQSTVTIPNVTDGTYTTEALIEHLTSIGLVRKQPRIELNAAQLCAARYGALGKEGDANAGANGQGIKQPGNPDQFL